MTQDRYQAEVMDELRMQDEWQGLSKDEIEEISHRHQGKSFIDGLYAFYEDIEARLKELNYGKGR